MIGKIHQILNPFFTQNTRSLKIFWLVLSLTLAALYCLPALQIAFSGEYIVQDDARQHVFWMRRLLDPALFPNDFIADYFQSVAPIGYSFFYQFFAKLGIDPIFLSKILPMPLAWVTTAYSFGISLQFLPLPITGFFVALFLNQNLWLRDDIVSATPTAFVYPFFAAFLYYLLRHSFLGVGITVALLGLFYPQCMLVAVGILMLRLWQWQGKGFKMSQQKSDYFLLMMGLGVAAIVILTYFTKSSEFGEVISAAEAKTMAAFLAKGWSSFFTDNFSNFWFCGKRSGMFPSEWCILADRFFPLPIPPQIYAAFVLPILLKFPAKFPLSQSIPSKIILLPQIAIVSLSLFFIAHILVFKLHLPNRYTEHSLRILISVAAGISLTLILDAVWRQGRKILTMDQVTPPDMKGDTTTLNQNFTSNLETEINPILMASISQHPVKSSPGLALLLTGLIFVGIFSYPQLLKFKNYPFPITGYISGTFPTLYEFFQQQPKDSLIASLTDETNNLPTFTKRSIYVGGEGYALPYHKKYYAEISQRTTQLIAAQYSDDIQPVKQFIQQSGIDFWVLDKMAFNLDFVQQDRWLAQYKSAADPVLGNLRQGKIPILSKLTNQCKVLESNPLVVLSANCILTHAD